MLPHALESNVFALEIQLQLRTDPGTAYGALVDHRWSTIVCAAPATKTVDFNTGSWQLVLQLWCMRVPVSAHLSGISQVVLKIY